MEFIDIKVLKWELYNPRKDYKKPWWFALSNTITSDAMFSEFSDAEFKAWIHILCTASVQNSCVARVYVKHASRVCGIKPSVLNETIDKLKILEVIQVLPGSRTESVQTTNATEHNSTEHNTTNNIAQSGDFADFWSGYPRKVGKGKAAKSYWKLIKSGVSHKDLCIARDGYKSFCQKNGTEPQFIKHGSTFFGDWEQWLDPETGTSQDFSKININDRNWEEILGPEGEAS